MKKGLIILFFTVLKASGQIDDQTYLVEYKKAVQLFANSQYEEASQKLAPLCSNSYSNPIVPYSYFYSALSSRNRGNNYQSRVIFRQLFENFNDWDKINEARINYADLNFSENYFEEALKNIELINDPAFNDLKNRMLNHYIPKIQSISNLKDLYFKFPTQQIIALSIVKYIQSNRYNSKDDLELSDMLTNRFKFKDINNKESKSSKKVALNEDKIETINFAVLLPFNISETKSEIGKTSNRYSYDIFMGMKMAVNKLALEGIKTNVYAFDIQKSKTDFLKFEKTGELNKMDVFVGPLYSEPNVLANDFAHSNKIIQVHPLSNNLELLKKDRQIFLVQPSYTQQAKKSLEFTQKKQLDKTVSIYFGTGKKDSLFAISYQEEAIKLGYKISILKKFTGANIKIAPEKGHIFLVVDMNLGTKFLQNLERNKIFSQVMCTATSFNWENVTKSSFKQNVAIIYPEYVNESKASVEEFKKNYTLTMNASSSYYNYVGYDMVLYFSRMLKDGKDIFKLNIESGPYTDDYLQSGFDFSGKPNENKIVPIVTFNGENFEEVFR